MYICRNLYKTALRLQIIESNKYIMIILVIVFWSRSVKDVFIRNVKIIKRLKEWVIVA